MDELQLDFIDIIAQASNVIEKRNRVVIQPSARTALLTRVNDHMDAIRSEYAKGTLSQDDILQAAVAQLDEAVSAARERNRIAFLQRINPGFGGSPGLAATARFLPGSDATTGLLTIVAQLTGAAPTIIDSASIALSMVRKCHWIPWC